MRSKFKTLEPRNSRVDPRFSFGTNCSYKRRSEVSAAIRRTVGLALQP
jgi:hypothetical protein